MKEKPARTWLECEWRGTHGHTHTQVVGVCSGNYRSSLVVSREWRTNKTVVLPVVRELILLVVVVVYCYALLQVERPGWLVVERSLLPQTWSLDSQLSGMDAQDTIPKGKNKISLRSLVRVHRQSFTPLDVCLSSDAFTSFREASNGVVCYLGFAIYPRHTRRRLSRIIQKHRCAMSRKGQQQPKRMKQARFCMSTTIQR